MKRLYKLLPVGATCFIILACTNDQAQDDNEAQEEASFQASQAELLADSRVSDGQREALQDGEVDIAELEAAGLEYEECMRDLGFDARFIIEASGDYFTEGSIPEGVDIDEFEPLEEDCEVATVRLVTRQYSFQRRLPADVREARSDYFRECVDNSDTPELPETEATCWDEAVEAIPAG